VLTYQQRWRHQADANPTDFFRNVLQPALEQARLVGASFLGSDADGMGFVYNTTTGISAILASLPFSFRDGDQILTTDHVYGAVDIALRRTAERSGADVEVVTAHVSLAAEDDEIIACVMAAVTDRTRVALVDHVTSVTARRFPVDRLVPALQERGVVVIVDGAHAPGSVPVDLGSMGPDFWVGNFHKWAGAPRGSAALYAAPKWRETLAAFPVSWQEMEGFPRSFSHVGTADTTCWLSVPAGLGFYEKFGWEHTRRTNAALAAYGQQVVGEAVDASLRDQPLEPTLPMRLVPLDAVPGTQADADTLRDRLAVEYGIETSINAWGGRTLLRLSAQLYNSMEDYEKLAAALPGVLAAG
jgi:isopenicillin-N epimerase